MIDLISAIDSYHRNKHDERDKPEELHVSDLSDCARAVWSRRNGEHMLGFSAETQRKFDLGNATERALLEALAPQLCDEDWTIMTGQKVSLDGVVGHPDFFAVHPDGRSFVGEIKSTTFYPKVINGKRERVPPTECSPHYIAQAAAYAVALGAQKFVVLIMCRESGMLAEFWFETERFESRIRASIDEAKRLTGVGNSMPEASPPEAWRCKYCRALSCHKNTNPEALVLHEGAA